MSVQISRNTLPPPPPPPQWVLDLDLADSPAPKPRSQTLDPPGYTPSSALSNSKSRSQQPSSQISKSLTPSSKSQISTPRVPPTTEEMDALKLKKAWEVAIAPAKSLPMSAIGMWMSGNSLQIFSIFMLFQLFKAPIAGLLGTGAQFKRFESEGNRGNMVLAKIVFVLCNLLGIAMGVWKIDRMGLLPTTRSDWLAWETRRMPSERAVPGFPL